MDHSKPKGRILVGSQHTGKGHIQILKCIIHSLILWYQTSDFGDRTIYKTNWSGLLNPSLKSKTLNMAPSYKI
jgi:hypothetical protein